MIDDVIARMRQDIRIDFVTPRGSRDDPPQGIMVGFISADPRAAQLRKRPVGPSRAGVSAIGGLSRLGLALAFVTVSAGRWPSAHQ
jgi:hypothetical protein